MKALLSMGAAFVVIFVESAHVGERADWTGPVAVLALFGALACFAGAGGTFLYRHHYPDWREYE